jgi:hypothetical protein
MLLWNHSKRKRLPRARSPRTRIGTWIAGRMYVHSAIVRRDTRGVVATYDGKLIDAFYFDHCDGKTRDGAGILLNAPAYLKSVPCPCGFATMKGHGVGMCQRGMLAMARFGDPYDVILKHYYSGITLEQAGVDAATTQEPITPRARKDLTPMPHSDDALSSDIRVGARHPSPTGRGASDLTPSPSPAGRGELKPARRSTRRKSSEQAEPAASAETPVVPAVPSPPAPTPVEPKTETVTPQPAVSKEPVSPVTAEPPAVAVRC